MRPPLRNLGGHAQFYLFMNWFQSLYSDSNRPIYDVLGRRVLFDQEPLLDDCAHVCYGGTNNRAYKEEFWDQKRAERIAWIERALIAPTKIHPDSIYKDRHKYLLFLGPDDHKTQDNEFYCVIVRVINPFTVAFLTAYPIDQKTFDRYAQIPPRIYPPSKKKKKR